MGAAVGRSGLDLVGRLLIGSVLFEEGAVLLFEGAVLQRSPTFGYRAAPTHPP
jgi:hypothetical protein